MTYRELLNTVKNLDEEIDLSLLNKEKKAYIYITGYEDEKVFIEGDTCYEVSTRLPGQFSWYESQEIIDKLYNSKEWRLPTIDEMRLLYESGIIDYDFNSYWSSSSLAKKDAWIFDFSKGISYGEDCGCHYSVRVIRSFKKGDSE